MYFEAGAQSQSQFKSYIDKHYDIKKYTLIKGILFSDILLVSGLHHFGQKVEHSELRAHF